jgi:osmoprotectant transport system ATP-binding protein
MVGSVSEPAVELCEVSKYFAPGQAALSQVSFRVEPGETLVLLGSSGSGKTTCLKMVNRLVEPDQGTVSIEGRDAREWDPITLRRRTGYVIQDVGLLPHLSVEENIALVPRLEGWEKERRRNRARELLELVRLDPDQYAGKRPSQLSGGEKQRVGVARALAIDPPLLQQRLGKSVLFVTHDVPEALRLADRVAVMDRGKIRQIGPAQEILERPADEFVREFVRLEPVGGTG